MKIVLLGAGNVATHLVKAFEEGGHDLLQIWSRKLKHARQLTQGRVAEAIGDLSDLDLSADLYVISVKDEAIADVAGRLTEVKGLVVHTSGSTSMDVLKANIAFGVLYPLQTFSKQKPLDLRKVPLCIEASDTQSLQKLRDMARTLSDVVEEIDSGQRKVLHLAAVFACNFTNHLYHISQQLVEKRGLNFNLLKPLISETADKIYEADPKDVQTGPAIRRDNETINTHLDMLEGCADLQEIYTILSKSIKKSYQ